MATIRRHPVPPESYEPDRPLNDLGRDQLKHFIHVAERLPAKLRAGLPPAPSPEDGPACSLFIAEVTNHLISRKKTPLRLTARKPRRSVSSGISLAAAVESASSDKPSSRKPRSRSKAKPGGPKP